MSASVSSITTQYSRSTGWLEPLQNTDDFVESSQRRVVAAGAKYLLARTDIAPEHILLQLLRDG